MSSVTCRWLGRIGKRSSGRCRRSSTRRPLILERLEARVALSSLPTDPRAFTLAVTPAAQTLVARNASYSTPLNTPLNVKVPGLLAFVSPQLPNLVANFGGTGPSRGALQLNPNGSFTYTPNINYSGPDQFTYYATSGSTMSNVATVYITVKPTGSTLLPDTPYYNALRRRWAIDPARFDYYHPRIGALFGLEATGIPDKPTAIVRANKDFNVTAALRVYDKNPAEFDQKAPIIVRFSNWKPRRVIPRACCPIRPITANSKSSTTAIPASIK